ncbi:MAG: site-specific integrase [Acidobacteria bacterium]|nr:site-specific integrase [Acidobacteriota bacterium]MCI0718203.1 site-specific integrase [Acidobacteriota bacterium]
MATEGQLKAWERLRGKIADEVLLAPKTGGDPHNQGDWREVPSRIVDYLERNVAARPWGNSLALMAAVLMAQRYDLSTVKTSLCLLHVRLSRLFEAFGLKTFRDWDPQQHIPACLKKDVLPEDSLYIRDKFWASYKSATRQMMRWQESLPENNRQVYKAFLLPAVNPLRVEGLTLRTQIEEHQKQTRKKETDAVVPRFAELRAEAHFRYNRLSRLRRAYQEALRELEGKACDLPLSFSYDEGREPEKGIPFRERLYFRVWDRRTFVLAHAEDYSCNPVHTAQKGVGTFTDQRNTRFLEFVKAERLADDTPPEGFWFFELLERGVLGLNAAVGSPDKLAAKQEWLRSWGYGPTPFLAECSSLLTWPVAEARFMCEAQRRSKGLLIPLEPLHAAAMFGLLATDLFTTTGARINEVMQIRLTKDCIVQLTMPAPPGARDPLPRVRYALRLIPKGEPTDTPQDYFIGEETKRLLVKAAQMLSQHYCLQPGEALPVVAFDPYHGRSHRFREAPYLFQYNHRHLSDQTISSSMRFLLHGMVFKTRDGKMVVLKPHLLRHAFATHAVQVERIPLDIVGTWLHQKSVEVTDYYSKPTESMVAEASDLFLARVAAQIDVHDAVLRSSEELQTLFEEARGKAGTLAEVIGGHCVSHGYCAAKFACVGCAGKVPDPTKRYQIERHRQWALEQVDFATHEGLHPEATRMKQLVRECDNELSEMDLIDEYRKDEKRDVIVQISNG